MEKHIRILGILYIISAILSMVVGTLFLLFFGGLAGLIGVSEQSDPDAWVAIPILGAVGGFIFLLLTVLSIPGLIAGFGLMKLRPWARIVTIVLSALHLMNFPVGTALGAYGLWVLLNSESARLFEQRT